MLNPHDMIEMAQGRTFTEDEEIEIQQWQLGCDLRGVSNTKGWLVAMNMLEEYVAGAQRQLMNLAPGDERVITAHAAASALTDQLNKFKEDVASAVHAAESYPQALVNVLNRPDYSVQKMD